MDREMSSNRFEEHLLELKDKGYDIAKWYLSTGV